MVWGERVNGPQNERLCQIRNYKDGWQEEDKDDKMIHRMKMIIKK